MVFLNWYKKLSGGRASPIATVAEAIKQAAPDSKYPTDVFKGDHKKLVEEASAFLRTNKPGAEFYIRTSSWAEDVVKYALVALNQAGLYPLYEWRMVETLKREHPMIGGQSNDYIHVLTVREPVPALTATDAREGADDARKELHARAARTATSVLTGIDIAVDAARRRADLRAKIELAYDYLDNKEYESELLRLLRNELTARGFQYEIDVQRVRTSMYNHSWRVCGTLHWGSDAQPDLFDTAPREIKEEGVDG
ncbi:porin [Burkholderia phage BcepSauron]|uniref:Porin n=1 Tax=Burkholderia phage BcepSauron TaxID=2530033 RepID=A0A482MM20_9CAUD|nr:porin [Burkholderia phage BcepSauron]QBQ74709.1 porin [Burkholderia phage BcepSauron]